MRGNVLRKIAKEWIKQIKTNPEERVIHPLSHIKSIDDIDCYIRLHFQLSSSTSGIEPISKYNLILKITPYSVQNMNDSLLWNYFYYCNENEHIVINNETHLVRALKTYAKMIHQLQFDRFTCSFEAPMNYLIHTELRDLFAVSDSVLPAWEECSVCMVDTLVKTTCNHFICVPCAEKSSYIGENTSCPQCRKENALEYVHIES